MRTTAKRKFLNKQDNLTTTSEMATPVQNKHPMTEVKPYGSHSQIRSLGGGGIDSNRQSPTNQSILFKPKLPAGISLRQLNLKEAARKNKKDDMLDYYRMLEEKDAEINNLTNRIQL